MKKVYVNPLFDVISFAQDIMTTSTQNGIQDGGANADPNWGDFGQG